MPSWPFCAAMCSVLSQPFSVSVGEAVERSRRVLLGCDSYSAWLCGGGMDSWGGVASERVELLCGIRACCC